MKLPRRTLLLSVPAALSACTAIPKPIAFDHLYAAKIHSLAVPAIGWPDSPTVVVINTASDRMASFGLIGLTATAVGATVRSNRRAALRSIMAAQSFDPRTYLQTALAQALASRSLTTVGLAAAETRDVFLPALPPGTSQDALLDCYVPRYGFFAAGDADADPFRPTVELHTQLVDAHDSSVLMRDTVIVSGSDGPERPSSETTPGSITFTTFSAIEQEPARAMAALRYVLDQAALGVAKRLA